MLILIPTICSSFTTVAVDKNFLIIDNVKERFTLYWLDSLDIVQAFLTDIPVIYKLKQVTFTENEEVIVDDGNYSAVYVVD